MSVVGSELTTMVTRLIAERDELKRRLDALPESTIALLTLVEKLEAEVRSLKAEVATLEHNRRTATNQASSSFSSSRCVGCGVSGTHLCGDCYADPNI